MNTVFNKIDFLIFVAPILIVISYYMG